MNRTIIRIATLTLGTAGVFASAAPAFAGQAYQAPGFPSSHASCVGTALNFGAHYGTDGENYPTITHGTVGPAVSGHARNDSPGAVGDFNSTLAADHGAIWDCLP